MFIEYLKQEAKRLNRQDELIFQNGRKCGIEEGRREGLRIAFSKTKEVSEEKYKKLMQFLVDNEIEMCYTENYENDMRNCGLVVRERKY